MRRWSFALITGILFSIPTAYSQVAIELAPPENSTQKAEFEVTTDQVLDLAGMGIETKVEVFGTSVSKGGKRDEDGKLTVENKMDRMQMNLNLPGGIQLQWDSGDPDKEASNEALKPLVEMMRTAFKYPETVTYNKDNAPIKSEFPQEAFDKGGEMFKADYAPEARLKAMKAEIDFLPGKPVKVGEKWDRTIESAIGGGQSFKIDYTFEYVGSETKDGKTLDRIKGTPNKITYSMEQTPQNPLKSTKSDLKVTEHDVEYVIDRNTKSIQETKSKLRIQGALDFEFMGQALPGKLDLKLNQKSKVTAS